MRVDAKVPGALKGNYVAALAAPIVALALVGSPWMAAASTRAAPPRPAGARWPTRFARRSCVTALRKLGGAHYHATLKYAVGRPGAAPLAITTTTDVWLDRAGN